MPCSTPCQRQAKRRAAPGLGLPQRIGWPAILAFSIRHRLTWKTLADIDPEFAAMAQVMAFRYNYTVAAEDRLPTLRDCPQQRCFFRSRPRGGLAVWSCRLVPATPPRAFLLGEG